MKIWDDNEMLERLIALGNFLDRKPKYIDLMRYFHDEDGEQILPSEHAYAKHFGSLEKALRKAGFEPRKYRRDILVKYRAYDTKKDALEKAL